MIGPHTELPINLPIPEDDGAVSHLVGMRLPSVKLISTSGETITLAELMGLVVIYAYPRTGEPGRPLPTDWESIPGAVGCTLESCGFRDHFNELVNLGASVFGLSTQPTEIQIEARERLHLPFDLLSDHALEFIRSMDLPTISPDGITMIKRLTLICNQGMIEHVFYPIFPPDEHADAVVKWLSHRNS